MADTMTAVAPALQEYEPLTEAARRLGLAAITLRRAVANGELEAWKVGSRILLRRGDADKLLRPATAPRTAS
jgi:excisionase family DNA binding protein